MCMREDTLAQASLDRAGQDAINGDHRMTITKIQAVAFDLGGTLEDLYSDEASRLETARGLYRLLVERGLDPCLSLRDLQATVLSGLGAYHQWREKREVELPPERVWTEFIFPDRGLPKDRLAQAAEDLMFFYETHAHVRTLRPEAPAALDALRQRGFRLAVISNIVSRRLAPARLEQYGIARYFDPILTSVEYGWRKPNERIFHEAARLMNLPPAACAYVGDTVSRDVIGARRAGYRLAIQIQSFLTSQLDRGVDPEPPDVAIENLMQVVDVVTRSKERC
jgi:putative hydrolase of the HAD superfamily